MNADIHVFCRKADKNVRCCFPAFWRYLIGATCCSSPKVASMYIYLPRITKNFAPGFPWPYLFKITRLLSHSDGHAHKEWVSGFVHHLLEDRAKPRARGGFKKKRKKTPGNKHVFCGCNHLNKTRQKPCWVLCASSSTRNKLSLWETSQSSITRWHVLLVLMISWLKSAGHEQNSVNTSKERAEAQDNACCGSLWIVLSVS